MESFNRYLPIIENADGFLDSLQRPQPISFWCNPLKTSCKETLAQLPKHIHPQPITWTQDAFKVPVWHRAGCTLAHQSGWYYLQEEIAMAAVAALAPQPGEQILDLCAAPGGKTGLIALRVGPTGTVVANDFNAQRQPQLSVNLSRLGLMNVLTSQADGRYWQLPAQRFDRVLVDVPCSGEGQIRKSRGKLWNRNFSQKIQRVQTQLLAKALSLVKPGGIVVYSTCTFAPEENEAIINQTLGDQGYLEPVNIPALHADEGQLHWRGNTFRSDLIHARRYWPHMNDTGGFFLARIRRRNETMAESTCKISHKLQKLRSHPCLEWLIQRFGLPPHTFDQHCLWDKGQQKLWLSDFTDIPPGIVPQVIGLPVAQYQSRGFKPTTAFLQRFGPLISRNWIDLPTADMAVKFMQGHPQTYQGRIDHGFVHVRYGPYHLGCGLCGNGMLYSQIPKSLRL